MCNTCIALAVQDFYGINAHYSTRLVLHTRDSKGLVVGAVYAAVDLLKNVGVQAIVGPQQSAQAKIVADIGSKAQVPVISFSATSLSISRRDMPYFLRMTQNDGYQLQAIASIIVAYEWKEVVLIHEETDYGNGIIPYMIDLFEAVNVCVPYICAIPSNANEDQIYAELKKLLALRTRVFIVHMASKLGSLFFVKVEEVGLMNEGNAWIITEGMTSILSSMNFSVIDAMRGVLGIKPYIPRSKEFENFRVRVIKNIIQEDGTLGDVNIFCLQAHDTIWALAMAAERVATSHNFQQSKTYNNLTDLAELGISEIGPRLLKETIDSKFEGRSGEIRLVDGQMQPVVFQIINVVSPGEREIGFWIPTVGISKRPYVTSENNLQPVIWPGESLIKPPGSMHPENGKRLKIGYAVKDSWNAFVQVNVNHTSGETIVTGHCISVFKAVMEAIPYALPYDFVPFLEANGENVDGYNDVIHQDFLQNYDAVVGDITITANRSESADFSFPYTSGGVAMIIPTKYDKRSNLILILSPYLSDVLALHFVLFIILKSTMRTSGVGYAQQIAKISKIPWMLLSAIIAPFNQMKGVKRIFTLLTIVAVYLVMVQLVFINTLQLITLDVKDLLKSGDLVGHRRNPFVEIALKQMNFQHSQLRVYSSPEAYGLALEQGSVAAVFDELPYIKVLLEKYCGKYRRVGPIYKTKGFGFVFPKGSPLVPDVSRAISSVVEVEGEKIEHIQSTWLGRERTCPDPPKTISSNTISLEKFSGLFVICSMFIIFSLVLYLLAHGQRESQHMLWSRLGYIFEFHVDSTLHLQEEQLIPSSSPGEQPSSSGTQSTDETSSPGKQQPVAQTSTLTAPSPFHIGVILDLETWNGKMSHTCISMAVQDFYTLNDHYKTRLVLHTRDSKDVVSAVSAAVNLLKDVKVQAIVGPQKSAQVQTVADLGNRTQAPVVSFSATSPSLSRNQMPYFIRMARSDAYQLEAIASVVQAFHWKEVVVIYEETDYGNGIIPCMNDLFESYNIRVPYKSVIPSKAVEDQILKELHKLLAMQTRVFIVHISYSLAPLFFQKVNEVGLMGEGIKPYIPRSRELDKFRVKLITKTIQESEKLEDLNVFCLHAYDTIWALAMAAERVGMNHSLREPNKSNNLADFAKVGISDVGPRLLKEILKSKFSGLSGVIRLDDGQLQPLVFQIINVVGHGEREIGFWIPAVGISQIPDVTTTTTKLYKSLRPIIWPGESTTVPKGSMKKLKIGYPVKNYFREFVKAELNFSSNGTLVTGYCIDVFKAVMEAIPYDIPYDFVPFEKGNSENESSYNHLVRQFHLQKYDAVVGDITVTSNRSLSVDFSFPYTTGGVEMLYVCGSIIAAAKDKKVSKFRVLIFVTTIVILLGLTMHVFAKVLLDDNPEFTIMGAKDFVKSGDFVGYQKGSYVKAVLKQLKFDESQLKAYNSPEEYDEALSKGSQNGGVAAIFDEIPYIKLFLNKYCGKYRTVGPIYKMEGFGFVFQKGSSLVLDINRALLSVLEGEKIAQIETRWLGSGKTCPTPPEHISSNIISLDKIWKLFIILYILFMLARINRQSDHPFWQLLRYFFEIDRGQLTKCEPVVADTSNGQMSPQVDTFVQRLWKTVDDIE
ncbi:Glutamate receptor 2.2 [Thalictrum thalictroides]|uniref:Glutamate receptor 2.2 n=1 Tax=Thalictrum thalictroides TaxID=46969 RepID=A0A7J6WDU5_THATH|nr:Glutamate receptor 2.2 [Thalictrum thalictroides]